MPMYKHMKLAKFRPMHHLTNDNIILTPMKVIQAPTHAAAKCMSDRKVSHDQMYVYDATISHEQGMLMAIT